MNTRRDGFLLKFYCFISISLRPGLLLLLLVKSEETDSGDLDDLEPDSGNISHGVSRPSETGDEDLVVLIDIVEAAVAGDEGSDLLAVLDELDADALADGGVGLLGLDSHLLEDNAFAHGGAAHGVGLEGREGVGLAVFKVGPLLGLPVVAELPSGVDSCGLSHFYLFSVGVGEGGGGYWFGF